MECTSPINILYLADASKERATELLLGPSINDLRTEGGRRGSRNVPPKIIECSSKFADKK